MHNGCAFLAKDRPLFDLLKTCTVPMRIFWLVLTLYPALGNDVLSIGNITEGSLGPDGKSVLVYASYPHVKVIGETVGWSVFVWFLIWISIFRGVGMTGRVVYFTMGLPILTTIIFVGRALSLENAREGVALLWTNWRSDQLASGTVWQTAVGQVSVNARRVD